MTQLHRVCAVALLAVCARADFSYTSTRRSTGGMMNSAAMSGTTKMYLKDQKMKVEMGDTSTIMDFAAQTITTVNSAQKTWSTRRFSDIAAASKTPEMDIHADVRETGQKKNVNGFNASELVATFDIEMSSGRAGAAMGKMQAEVDSWISSEVPGSAEVRAFYQRNGSNMPWASLVTGANSGMQQAMADLQKKLSAMNGVPVQQIMRITSPGMSAQLQSMAPAMAKARAQMEAMIAKGGPQAEMAKKALAAMPGMSAGGAAGGPLMEITMDSSDFSTAGIPASVFAIPSDFKETPAAR